MTMEKEKVFDFDTPVERIDTASLKWNKYKDRDVIPLWAQDGIEFDGHGFMRLNSGCSRSLLEKALQRMTAAMEGHFGKTKN